jgi:hypothetical protein
MFGVKLVLAWLIMVRRLCRLTCQEPFTPAEFNEYAKQVARVIAMMLELFFTFVDCQVRTCSIADVRYAISYIPGCENLKSLEETQRIANTSQDALLRKIARLLLQKTPSREEIFAALVELVTSRMHYLGEGKWTCVYRNFKTSAQFEFYEGGNTENYSYYFKSVYPLITFNKDVPWDAWFHMVFPQPVVVSSAELPTPGASVFNTDAPVFVPAFVSPAVPPVVSPVVSDVVPAVVSPVVV